LVATSIEDVTDASDSDYKYTWEITLDYETDGDYYSDWVFPDAWSVEWTENTADADSVDAMFTAVYTEWAIEDATVGLCTGDYAYYIEAPEDYASGTEMETTDDICAYNVYFEYADGLDADDATIDPTVQVFTVHTDSNNAVATAASALVVAGVAAMFF
jgi:hypothetical protein